MIYAQERPTTPELDTAYPLDLETERLIAGTRITINSAIAHPDARFLLAGPCALTDEAEILLDENRDWQEFAAENGLVVAVRRHPWKPRSVEDWEEKLLKWHGLETGYDNGSGSPEEAARVAYEIMYQETRKHKNVSMEMAFPHHVLRYGPLVSFAQVGARTRDQYYNSYDDYLTFLDLLARREPTLPIGIKNDNDGSITRAVEEVNRVNEIRSQIGIAATHRAVLIYRGGESVRTPETWEASAITAIERTRGAVILDVAHGGEQAFDPAGNYNKTVEGQLACLESAKSLGEMGLTCVGYAVESSTIKSPMDPPAAPEDIKMRLKGAKVAVAA